MNMNEVKAKILQKIGEPVEFSDITGILKDRVLIPSNGLAGGGQFVDVIDFIEFQANNELKEAIRFGYYSVDEEGRLLWVSRRALTEDTSVILNLFKIAYKRPWFQELIEKCRE